MNSAPLFSTQLIDVCKRALSTRPGIDLIASLDFQRRQALRRAAAARRGITVPAILIASVTRRCNLSCAGCYAQSLRPSGEHAPAELRDEQFMEIFEEALSLGVGVIMIAGGEPLVRLSLLKSLAERRGIIAPVFTNGTLLDSRALMLFGHGLFPVLSVEGDESFTSERRGKGVHEAVLERVGALRETKTPFGLSITVSSRNAESVLSPGFLGGVASMGASVLFLVEYVSVAEGSEGLALSSEQRAALNDRSLTRELPYPVVRLPGDVEASGGCLAAGRGFAHVSPEGELEACPFAPFSDANAADSGLAAALDSKLMRAIRERHDELMETSGGCALRDKASWVASLGSCAGTVRETVGAA
jgi:MoaA/NifB/PqqE/SkfB family radical SAM enzyme